MTEFDKIYQEYFHDVFLYVRQLSHGNEALAEEITSEAFFKAMRAIDHFRGDCNVRVWLCQIAKNCYYTYLKNNRQIADFSHEELENHPDPTLPLDEMFGKQENADAIRELLHDLVEPYKEVFMWRVFGELSFKQIGALFSKTENWACVTYHRAKTIIRKRMEATYHEK